MNSVIRTLRDHDHDPPLHRRPHQGAPRPSFHWGTIASFGVLLHQGRETVHAPLGKTHAAGPSGHRPLGAGCRHVRGGPLPALAQGVVLERVLRALEGQFSPRKAVGGECSWPGCYQAESRSRRGERFELCLLTSWRLGPDEQRPRRQKHGPDREPPTRVDAIVT